MSREWDNSTVMSEFAKIAKDLGLISSDLSAKEKEGFMKNVEETVPTGDDYTRNKKTEEYDAKDSKIMEKAHKKDSYVAKAMGEGALVENNMQQHKKMLEIAIKMPTGTLIGVHASVVDSLVKMANELEENGKMKEAQLIDNTIKELCAVPFYFARKEAIAPAVPLVIPFVVKALAVAATAMGIGFGGLFSSYQEGIKEDTKDLLDVLREFASKSASAKKAYDLLNQSAVQFMNVDLSSEKGIHAFLSEAEKFKMRELERLVEMANLEIGSSKVWKFLGFGSRRVEEKFTDFKDSFEKTLSTINKYSKIGENIQKQDERQDVKGIQKILYERGFLGSKWSGEVTGILDKNTSRAIKELESKVTNALSKIPGHEDKNFSDKILRGDKLQTNSSELNDLLNALEKKLS